MEHQFIFAHFELCFRQDLFVSAPVVVRRKRFQQMPFNTADAKQFNFQPFGGTPKGGVEDMSCKIAGLTEGSFKFFLKNRSIFPV